MKGQQVDSSHASAHRDHSHNAFDNVEMFVTKLDAPERDVWQKPDKVISLFNLPENAVVVEIGAGTGYFAVRLAPQLKNGKIICFDQSPKMTSYLKDRAAELRLRNIEVRTTKPDGDLDMEEKADLIFSVDVYHHIEDRIPYFSRIAQHLKPEGALFVIDRTEEKIEGQPSGHRVPKEKIKEEMQEAGYELVNDFDFLLPVQYYLAFKRAS